MAKKKTAARPAPAKKATRKKTTARARARSLAPAKAKRGLAAGEIALPLDAAAVAPLVREIVAAGGSAIGAYREPLAGGALLVASLPIEAVQPTPFQRDLSPTHAKRLAQKIEEANAFLDPIIVVRGAKGELWTPNGRHRLAAAKVLGLRQITAIVAPDEHLAFRILALNTEKAHNLKDRSLEVIRMAQALAKRDAKAKEKDFAAEFESPEFLTLGLIYAEHGRFAGSAYAPLLRKVDRFEGKPLAATLRARAGYAARLVEIDAMVRDIIEQLQARGFRSPYLRTFVVARLNPVRSERGARAKPGAPPPMTLAAALTRMRAAAAKFDPSSVRHGDLALVAAVAPEPDEA